jgi:septum formation topological specificity factor MinE
MGISPDLIDAMKKDLIMAIAKHMRIERDSVDMQVRRNGDSVMLKGNVRLLEAGKS